MAGSVQRHMLNWLIALKRSIALRTRLVLARERLRRYAAMRPARVDARSVVGRVGILRAREPGRQICCILLVEHMGDIIACEPIVEWTRDRYPGSRIAWVVRPEYAELLTSHPAIDDVMTVRSLAAVAPIVRSGAFDVAIDLHVNDKPTGIDGVRHLKSWGNPAIDARTYVRERSLLAALSKAAGIGEVSGEAVLYLPPLTVESVDDLLLPTRFAVIHAASNDPDRDWSPEGWSALVDYAVGYGIHIVEVGLESRLPVRPLVSSLCGRLSMAQTAEVIRRAAFFIGLDSGPAHMANVWHTPSLILLSRFKGHDWRPHEGFFGDRSEKVLLGHPGPLNTLTASKVIDRLQADEDWLRLAVAGISPDSVE